MARQIIPIDKVVKCHVNSNDSTPIYNQDYASSNFTDGYKLAFRYNIYKTIDLP